MEGISDITKIITDVFKPSLVIMEKVIKRRFANNFIQTYSLTSTTERTPLRFNLDIGNEPINKIEVISVGGGLTLWFNNNSQGTTMSAGSIIEDIEINRLEYKVTAGTANIMIFARAN